jgi:cob(I)alamin adenosyltransferase
MRQFRPFTRHTEIGLVVTALFFFGHWHRANLWADGAPENMPQVGSKEIAFLEAWIDRMEAELPTLKTFILPGGGAAVSRCHIARTVCRRAERRVVALEIENEIENAELLAYLNRLSDYFFVLGRAWMQRSGAEEIAWPLG